MATEWSRLSIVPDICVLGKRDAFVFLVLPQVTAGGPARISRPARAVR
jgi:hypothetical protein